MGYFISRLAASKSLTEGQVYTTPDVLDQFVKSPAEINNYLQQGGYAGSAGNIIDGRLYHRRVQRHRLLVGALAMEQIYHE